MRIERAGLGGSRSGKVHVKKQEFFLTNRMVEQQVMEKPAVFLHELLGKITKKITMIDKTVLAEL